VHGCVAWRAQSRRIRRIRKTQHENKQQMLYYQTKGDVMNLHPRKANVWVRLKREPAP